MMAEMDGNDSLRETESTLMVEPDTDPAEVIIDNIDSTASVTLNESGHSLATPKGGKRRPIDKASEEYRRKRERNNVAVKRSRNKTKVRVVATESRVKELENENKDLSQKIELLTKELTVLKSLFITSGTEINPKLISAADVITKVIRGESIPGASGHLTLIPGVSGAIATLTQSVQHS